MASFPPIFREKHGCHSKHSLRLHSQQGSSQMMTVTDGLRKGKEKKQNKTTPTETHQGLAGNKRWLVRARCALEKLWRRGKTQDKVPDGVTQGVLRNHWEYILKAQDFPLALFCPSPREIKGNLDSWYCSLLTPEIICSYATYALRQVLISDG